MTMLDRALFLESLGLSVFPLLPRDKRPNGEWKQFQSERPSRESITGLWSNGGADQNIAVACGPVSGVFVLDVDGPEGEASLAALEVEHGSLPQTWHVKTGRGRHYYFKDPGLSNSAGKVGDHLDTRGAGGYVVAPGSVHANGTVYDWEPGFDPEFTELAELPAWLVDRLQMRPERMAAPAVIDFNKAPRQRSAVDNREAFRAERYLQAMLAGAEQDLAQTSAGSRNQGLNDKAMRLGHFAHYGVYDQERAWLALSSACVRNGAWAEDGDRQCRATFESGWKAGVADPRDLPESEQAVQRGETQPASTDAPKSRSIQFLDLDQINELQPPTYVIDKLLTEQGFALIWGKQASFKSFFALDMALHMSYGRPFHGRETLPKRVLYIAGEGASGFKNRIGAWRKHYGQQAKGDFYMLATGINLVGKPGADLLIAAIREFGPPFDYIFVDTVARAMLGAEENDASSMGLFIQACDMVRSAFGCGLAAVHHAGKDAGQGPRGSTALPAAVDTDFMVERTEGTPLVTITCKKQKDDEEPEPFRFKAEKIDVSSLGITGQSSLVMMPIDDLTEVKERKLTHRNVNEFLEETRRAWDQGNPWSNSAQTRKDGRYLPEWIARRFEISLKGAEGYVSELLFNGFMTVEMHDKKTKKNGLKVLRMHPVNSGGTQEPD